MKELNGGAASDSDSGQASEEDDEEDAKRGQRAVSNAVKEKLAKRQVNGTSRPGIQTLVVVVIVIIMYFFRWFCNKKRNDSH